MTIKIAKLDFEQAIGVVGNTVSSTGGDISSHYVFRVKDGKLTIYSYNNIRVFSSCPVVADTDGDVMFTAEAWRVQDMLAAVSHSVLTLEPEFTGDRVTEVTITSDRGGIEFSCLDPSLFPFWDEQIGEAKETARINANRLKNAFAHARMFISTDEGKSPQLCVCEFRGGCLYSTDQTAVSSIRVVGMENSAIRVHGKDVGALISFLDKASDKEGRGEVTILEHERALFIKRDDGAVFGETLFGSRFPDFTVDWSLVDDFTWKIFREEFNGNVRFLSAGAEKGATKLTIEPKGNDLAMIMASVKGKAKAVDLKTTDSTKKADAQPLPEGGFSISHKHVTLALSDYSDSAVVIGVSKRGKGGWLRVRDERPIATGDTTGEKDMYLTTVAWLKKPV